MATRQVPRRRCLTAQWLRVIRCKSFWRLQLSMDLISLERMCNMNFRRLPTRRSAGWLQDQSLDQRKENCSLLSKHCMGWSRQVSASGLAWRRDSNHRWLTPMFGWERQPRQMESLTMNTYSCTLTTSYPYCVIQGHFGRNPGQNQV